MTAARPPLRAPTWTKRLLVEPRRPARVRDSPRAAWLVVVSVCIGAFMGQLDVSIVTLALPRLGQTLHASVGAVEWVSLSYLLVLVCSLTAVGRLADRAGRKLLYVYGFAVFTAGSLLCGLAPSLYLLIAARVLQGIGAAMLQANSVALIRDALPQGRLGRAIGIQGTAQALGLALGPAVGGALLALGGWRLIFLVNIPAGALGITLAWFLLPRSRLPEPRGERFDTSGALLMATAAGALMLALSLAHGFRPQVVGAILLLSLIAAWAFVRREASARWPLLDLQLLRRPAMSVGLSSGLASYAVMFGCLFVIPYYLAANHVSEALSGAQLATLPVALGLVAPVAGRLMDHRGARSLTVAGMVCAGASLLVLALAHGTAPRLIGLAGVGAGLGAFIPSNGAAVMSAAPRDQAGAIGGLLNVMRGLGTAIGIAITSLIYVAVAGQPGSSAPNAAALSGHGLTIAMLVLCALALAVGAGLLVRPRDALDPALGDGALPADH
jgi:EmrB/QacA subfamily drug resistance transporter